MVSPDDNATGVAIVSAPVTRIPAASSKAMVVSRPALPASCEWLLATLPTMATVLSTNRRSAAAAVGGWRNAKQLVERGPHFWGATPDPIAPSMFNRTRSAPARNGLSAGAILSGAERSPNCVQSVSAAYLAHFGSRFVPKVTSPPAQTRTGAESALGFANAVSRVAVGDCDQATDARLVTKPNAMAFTRASLRSRMSDENATTWAERPAGLGVHDWLVRLRRVEHLRQHLLRRGLLRRNWRRVRQRLRRAANHRLTHRRLDNGWLHWRCGLHRLDAVRHRKVAGANDLLVPLPEIGEHASVAEHDHRNIAIEDRARSNGPRIGRRGLRRWRNAGDTRRTRGPHMLRRKCHRRG